MKSLVLSDIHANLPALEAVLQHEGRWDDVLFLGDAISAGPQPNEVLNVLRELPGVWIGGNHDREPFVRNFPADDVNPDHLYLKWTAAQVSPENRRFVQSFVRTQVVERDGMKMRLYHGDFPARAVDKIIWSRKTPSLVRVIARAYRKVFLPPWADRIWPDTDELIFAGLCRQFPEPHVLLGHVHIQYRREVNSTVFVNPGSVGQPRLGRPLAKYAVIENGQLELRSVPYDVEAVCRALDAVPLDNSFIDDWKNGYRAGRLPARYRIRNWDELAAQGYT